MINGQLMTIEDLAVYLKVTRRTIYDWLKHNKIPAVKLIGQWRFRRDKIDAWIDGSTGLTINPERRPSTTLRPSPESIEGRSRRIENRSLH